jgi:hypothetical protein
MDKPQPQLGAYAVPWGSVRYDHPYAIEPFEPLQEKVGYKAVPLLVQLSSKPKSLRLLVRALRLSIPSHPISRLLLLL